MHLRYLYHWAIFNIHTIKTLEDISSLPAGTQIAKNSWGKLEYNGPCPPPGTPNHYVFSLYALDTVLKHDSEIDAQALLDAIQNHVLGVAQLKAVFGR